MTKIITRFFENAKDAHDARFELIQRQRLPMRIVHLFEGEAGLADTLTALHVAPKTAEAYAKHMGKGGAVVLVQAGFKPLNVARTTREVLDGMGAAAFADLQQEVEVKEKPQPASSILRDHPHILKRQRDPLSTNYHMADWPIGLISRRKPADNFAFPRHMRMAAFPIPLTDRRKPFTGSIFPPHARMANFPIPLISKRKPFTGSIFPPHARMANFPIPLISRRKPRNRSIFPRHQRMATVPFPLLINQKTGGNALMPGGPRMANFPISLLSDRKPFTGSIFSRHARMANFPLPLISKRKPFTGSIVPRHGRMANMFLPLITQRDNTADPDGGSGFSFSKKLGLRTILRR